MFNGTLKIGHQKIRHKKLWYDICRRLSLGPLCHSKNCKKRLQNICAYILLAFLQYMLIFISIQYMLYILHICSFESPCDRSQMTLSQACKRDGRDRDSKIILFRTGLGFSGQAKNGTPRLFSLIKNYMLKPVPSSLGRAVQGQQKYLLSRTGQGRTLKTINGPGHVPSVLHP